MTKRPIEDTVASDEPESEVALATSETVVATGSQDAATQRSYEPGAAVTPRTDVLTGLLDAPAAPSQLLLAALRSAMELPVVSREHYEVLSEHARGGLGRIVRARDKRTGRVVAIKEMLGGSDETARRFAREALITANLMHPAIVPVYELGRWPSGEPFYAMKLVLGRSLKDVIDGCKTLDERIARLPTVVSVAEALAYAHARRIIHRDLKPQNVLVGDLGETVVIDWGLAKTIGDADTEDDPILVPPSVASLHTVVGAVMGTPQYMPPEQARGEPSDERTDVYQIGALLYHLIAGVPPYAGRKVASSRELVQLVTQEPPLPLREREPGTPPDLLTIVEKAMARAPADRYANGGELTEDLRRFTTGQLVRAHHYDRRTLFARWLRRNRAPVTVGAVLAAVLAGVAIFSVRSIVAERDNAAAARDRAEYELSIALYEKGRAAEGAQEWARAAMYYAAARRHHDSDASAWAAGLAEARAVIPHARHQGHTAWVRAAAIAPDGERVATVDEAGQVRVWSPRDGHLFAARAVSTRALYGLAFSPDGSELAVAGDTGAIVRLAAADLAPRGSELRGHTGRVWTLAYSPDGKLLASGGEDRSVRLWSLAGGGAPRELVGHAQRVYAVAFSHDGARLASGSDDRHLWVWDVATGKGAQRGDHKAGGIRVVVFTPDDQRIVTSGWDHEIRVWKGPDPTPEVWSDADIVEGAAITPHDNLLVAGGQMPSINVWDTSTHQLVTALDAPDGPTSAVAVSRDGRWLVTAGKAPPIAWDASAIRRLAAVGHRDAAVGLAFSRDGARFASGSNDRTLRLWDVATTRELRRVTLGARQCGDSVVVLGRDELAASCDDATLRRWDAAGGERSIMTPDWLRVTSLSPDARTLAAGHAQGRLALVDVASWTIAQMKTLHAHHIYGVQYAADGRLVTASLDDHVRVWRTPDLAQDVDVKIDTEDGVLAAALAPDGGLLAIGTQDGALHVWDVRALRWRVRDLGGHTMGTVWKVIYGRDGAHVYSAADDGLVRVWDARTWTARSLEAGEGAALGLALSPDGATLAAGYKSGAIVLWDLATGHMRARIGGHMRDRGSCKDVATQTWSDDAHRAIVSTACTTPARAYFDALAARTHQRLEHEIDVTWDWR